MKSNHFFKGICAVLLAVFMATPVFAAVGAKSNGTHLCTATDINYSTNVTATCDGSTVTVVSSPTPTITGGTINNATIGATTPSTGVFTQVDGVRASPYGAPAGSQQYTRIINAYLTLYTSSATQRPASGAPAGTVVAITTANNLGDCGAEGGGTTYVVCSSDGTNWRTLSFKTA